MVRKAVAAAVAIVGVLVLTAPGAVAPATEPASDAGTPVVSVVSPPWATQRAEGPLTESSRDNQAVALLAAAGAALVLMATLAILMGRRVPAVPPVVETGVRARRVTASAARTERSPLYDVRR